MNYISILLCSFHLKLFGSLQAIVHLTVGCQPVHQGTGEEAGSDLIHPKHQESTSYYRGEILLRHIEPAISLIKRGESQLLDVGVRGGQLHIGASDTICRYFLVPYLEKFHKAFPSAHIKVNNQTSIKCVEMLESGQVDLIVVNSPNPYLGNCETKHIRSFQVVFVANHSLINLSEDA